LKKSFWVLALSAGLGLAFLQIGQVSINYFEVIGSSFFILVVLEARDLFLEKVS